jgi:hypothetical protein
MLNTSVGGFFICSVGAPKKGGPNVSDRKFHLDKRAEGILAKCIREELSDDQLLSPQKCACLLDVSIPWLELMRRTKRGPRFTKLSDRCVKYKVKDIRAWVRARAVKAAA